VPVEMIRFILKVLLKHRILAVYHDFHWLLLAAKLLTAKLHSRYVRGSEIPERSELGRTFHLRLHNPGKNACVQL